MTTATDVDPRSTTRPSLDEGSQQPSQPPHTPKLVHSPTGYYRPEEELYFGLPPLPQTPRTPQKPPTSRGVRRMSSVPELRESHRNHAYPPRSQSRQRSSSNNKTWDVATSGTHRLPPEIGQGRSRLIRQKSMERGIMGFPNRPSPQGKRIPSGGSDRRPGSRPGSRNGGNVHSVNGHPPPPPGLKMPLAFNSMARERGFTTGSQPIPQTPPNTARNNFIPPPALPGGYLTNPSTSAPDLPSTNENRQYHPRPHYRDPPRSHPYQAPQPPQPPFSAANSTNTSPHSSFGPPSLTDEIRTSFRSALSGSEINRSSSFTTTSETPTESSSNAMTVDEAIGMYASDTDEDESIMATDSERPRSHGDSVLGGAVSRQGSYVEDSGYRSKGDSVLGGEVSPATKSRVGDQESLLQEEVEKQRMDRARNSGHSGHSGYSGLSFPPPVAEEEIKPEKPSNLLDVGDSQPDLTPSSNPNPEHTSELAPEGSYEAGYPTSAIKEPPRDSPKSDPKNVRDRYGFRKQTQYVTLKEYEEWEVRYDEILDRRRKKWEELLRDSGLTPSEGGPVRFPPKSNKVKRYVRKGIPPEWRGAAWFWYAGGQKFLNRHPGLYDELVNKGPSAPDAELIERDLHRTFPDNIKFKPDPLPGQERLSKQQEKQLETPMVHRLRRVLGSFALHVPRIGYCQSLNFLAGLLLLFMPEEKAFWMLYILTQVHLPGTHEVNLEGSSVDQWVLMMSVHDTLPQIWSKIGGGLDGIEVDLETTKLPAVTLCTSSWFMSGFIGSLPIESVLRVWDCLFYEGSKTLFRIAMTIFKTGETQIKAVNDPMEIFQVVQTIPRKMADAGALIEACYRRRNGFGHLSQEIIDQRRQLRRDVFAEERAVAARGQIRVSKDDAALRGNMTPRSAAQAGNHGELGRKFRKILVKA